MEDKIINENAEINRKLVLWSCDHENNVSANYSNFLTTLAGFFIVLYPSIVNYNPTLNGLWIKIILSFSILFIFLSLIFGIIDTFVRKNFYSKWMNNYSEILNKWNICKDENDKKIAIACEDCIYSKNKTKLRQWPLIVQSILLFAGIFMTILVFIFKMMV